MSFDVLGSVAAAVVSMIVGVLWYSDALFGVHWRADMGFSDEMMEAEKAKGMGQKIALGFVVEFVTAAVFSYFFYVLGTVDVVGAMIVALLAWILCHSSIWTGVVG